MRGKTGKVGKAGARGPRGPAMKRSDVLAIVEDQFREVRQQLDLHLQRTAQVQAQLDHVEGLLKQLVREEVAS